MQLSDNSHDSLDANSPSVLDLLQVMGGVESPVVVQNITESDAGVLEGGVGLQGGEPAIGAGPVALRGPLAAWCARTARITV